MPYDRMPVGFFDKYFTEEGLSIRAELPEGEVNIQVGLFGNVALR